MAKLSSGDAEMRFKRGGQLFGVLLETGLNLIDILREQLPDDIKGRVKDTYDTASRRASRAADALRGEEDSQILGKAVALLVGVGIGVGIGVLFAPTSGEETRSVINDKISDFRRQSLSAQ
jgi:hypothetical protein